MNVSREPLRGAFALGTASVVDYALQFLAPLILVRVLSVQDFGHYRAFWLIANTAYALATIGMPFSLFYFIAREKENTLCFVSNVICFLGLTGSASAIAFFLFKSFLPQTVQSIQVSTVAVASFIVLWISGSLLDLLPNAENRVKAQANWIILFSIIRFVAVSGIALLTGSFKFIALSLLLYAFFKNLALAVEIVRIHGKLPLFPRWSLALEQLKYAVPFGVAGLLYNLREQGDQWIAAICLSLEDFALFSLAGVAAPVIGIIRQSVSNAFLPKISSSQHQGKPEKAVELNRSANWLTATILAPALAFGFFYSEELIGIVYTEKYRNAYLPLQIYLCGLASQMFVANNLMISMAKGNAMLSINAICLPISWILSWFGASLAGFSGAAVGSAITQWAANWAGLVYTKKILKVKLNTLVEIRKIGIYLLSVIVFAMVEKRFLENIGVENESMKIVLGGLPLIMIAMIASGKILKK